MIITVATLVFFFRSQSSPETPAAPLLDETPAPTTSAVPFSERDTDGDGLTDEQEVAAGTDSAVPDTDGDGYTDKQELDAGYDPKGPGVLDQDRDGLPDRNEEQLGTDARNADTDGDGYLDGQEVQNCYNPRVPSPDDKIAACPPYPGLQ
ncbi:MAG: thrombospondin type 3 repeat-containing protein [Parcubacteria group bacterium Gr01-1014_106]|nr:MAG: thrombospondin type 3 repeat-containing protein [Parcubacteria group bacterium Gr01-1014_106]